MSLRPSNIDLLTSPEEFFREAVDEAFEKRRVDTIPIVKNYVVGLLSRYILTERMSRDTLAEMYLRANNSEKTKRVELLQQLGDTSLYISGFFGDSLQRKVVDIDYYIEMGEVAYSSLSHTLQTDSSAKVFSEMSQKFVAMVDVLSYISQKSSADTNSNLLRLYEKYMKTGSDLAKDQILNKGLALPAAVNKKTKQ
ncbi:MAG: hypothetical protein A4S09_08760 [Proteobacteria bacterium SG_bin7]|nr:MAG: hypothetical protein A4S09_08760 [Proteobacteria bacterium SG_bin7]